MQMNPVTTCQMQDFEIKLELREQTLFMEARSKNNPLEAYWLEVSQDTMISNKIVFENPKELYEYLELYQFSKECLEFNPPKEMIILYKIGKNVKRMSLIMIEKELTKQEQQQAKIKSLQVQIIKLKKQMLQKHQNFRVMELQIIQEEKDEQILVLMSTIQEQKQEILALKQKLNNQKENKKNINEDGMLQQMRQLYKQIQQNKLKILTHEQTILSQTMIIDELQAQMKEMREIYMAINGEIKQAKTQQGKNIMFSHLLAFRPNKKSINLKNYDFNANILTKNDESLSGTGKFIYSDTPIPRIGRFHYKLKNKNSASLPNFRIGVICRLKLENVEYMNAGQSDSIMYYCYNTDKQIIYEGYNKVEAFNVKKDQVITVVIDAQKNQVEWYLQENLQVISKFTEAMRSAPQLFFFIQLWQNGDSIQILTK